MTRLKQSLGIIEVFAGLGAGAVMVWIVWAITDTPMSYVSENASGKVAESNMWFETLITNLPLVFLLLVAVSGISWSVYQSELV